MLEDYLSQIGNIDSLSDQYGKTYQFIHRSSRPQGALFYPGIALKIYHMIRATEPLPQNLVVSLNQFLDEELDLGKIDPKQGMGFAILSQGFLSVNIWGRGNVLFTQTYTIEKLRTELSPEPLEKTGVACTWEARIMTFEYELWHRFLLSKRGLPEKELYLQEFIAGDLDSPHVVRLELRHS